ncbi:MAG: DUF3857 domain-containing protein [Cyclobacteriaceae bacterium]|nr:MAG: DUF3857 domain-containing protein [Cyclobacteriaceae bacterium]
MRVVLIALLLTSLSIAAVAQQYGFPFGKTLFDELTMTTYERDTSASAVVLNEFGNAYIESENYNLIFNYHVKIKILKKDGLSQADIAIPLYKSASGKKEEIKDIKASTFNLVNNRIEESSLDVRNVFTEDLNKYWDQKKFALPNVRVGSVIEIVYTIESPFIFNFRKWEFQADIPKIQSEYWARIPGNYVYNITLKGFLKLTKNENSLISKCITIGSGYNAGSADCAQYKFAIKNVPAFIEEDYLTAKSNYLSAINFELSEIRHFDGRVDKITKEWKDAELELKKEQRFGGQLRRGKDISQKINEIVAGISDPAEKARRIYNFIKTWYRWNETYGYFSEFGIKKAFDTKTGNIGDINLSLIAALNFGGLSADPMLLSTRKNGLPIELHPVLSDFNYVVARVVIGDQIIFLDASDPFLMFGMLPERCINGKGRVFTDKGSFWEELKPKEKSKKITMLNLSLEQDGSFIGTIEHTYYGYRSVDQRKYIASFNSVDEYLSSIKKKLPSTEIISHEIEGFDDFESIIKEKFEVVIEGFDDLNKNNLLLNPFFTDKIESNPFKSNERLYPVDFGVPLERTMILTLNVPTEFELIGKPESNALVLPNSGGKFLFDITSRENQLQINYSLAINKTVFHSQEYQYLKELFSRIIQTQQSDLVFSRKE